MTPIFFHQLAFGDDEAAGDFIEAKIEIFQIASTHCLPDIIRMSQCIDAANIVDHMNYFRKHLTGMSPRLPGIYSVYRLFAREVIDVDSYKELFIS
jgi:hypothetical protein